MPSAFHTFFSFNPPKSPIRLLPFWHLFRRWENPSLERLVQGSTSAQTQVSEIQIHFLWPYSTLLASLQGYPLSHMLPHSVCCHFSSLGFSFCICKTGDIVQNTCQAPFQFLQYYSRKDFLILYTVQAGQPTHIYTYFGTYLVRNLKQWRQKSSEKNSKTLCKTKHSWFLPTHVYQVALLSPFPHIVWKTTFSPKKCKDVTLKASGPHQTTWKGTESRHSAHSGAAMFFCTGQGLQNSLLDHNTEVLCFFCF